MVSSKPKNTEDRRFGRPSYGKPKSQLTVFGKALQRTFSEFPDLYAADISAVVRAQNIGRITNSQISGIKKGSQNLRATSIQDIILGIRERDSEAFEFYLETLVTLLRKWEPSQDSDYEASMEDAENVVDFINDWMQREEISQEELEELLDREGLSAEAFREILAGRQVNEAYEMPRLARVIRQSNGEVYTMEDWRVLCGYPPIDFSDQKKNGHPLNNGLS
jgi:hypothetical protein